MAKSPPARGRRGRRGFTLAEVVVVVAILALTIAIGVGSVSSAVKRQRVASAAEDLKTLAARALSTMQDQNRTTFLVVGRYVAGTGTDAAVVFDANGNNVCDEAIDPNNDNLFFEDAPRILVPWRIRIPEDVALSNSSPTGQVFNTQWARPATGPVSAALLCDFMGRAMIPGVTVPTPPATAAIVGMATGPATVQLSHADMISGDLTPLVTYTVSVTPLFKASVRRVP